VVAYTCRYSSGQLIPIFQSVAVADKCMFVIAGVNDGCGDVGDSTDTNMFTSKKEKLF